MDFNDTPQEAEFRREAAAWLDDNAHKKEYPNQTWASLLTDKSSANIVRLSREYQRRKYQDGWACLHWPREFGGRGTTPMERVIWGSGDGSTLPVVPTEIGKIGSVICWENYMPLLRTAMYAQGIELYCAITVDDRDSWLHTVTHIALEGRCFVPPIRNADRWR